MCNRKRNQVVDTLNLGNRSVITKSEALKSVGGKKCMFDYFFGHLSCHWRSWWGWRSFSIRRSLWRNCSATARYGRGEIEREDSNRPWVFHVLFMLFCSLATLTITLKCILVQYWHQFVLVGKALSSQSIHNSRKNPIVSLFEIKSLVQQWTTYFDCTTWPTDESTGAVEGFTIAARMVVAWTCAISKRVKLTTSVNQLVSK